jgi:hypothetical protein
LRAGEEAARLGVVTHVALDPHAEATLLALATHAEALAAGGEKRAPIFEV